MTDTTLPTLPMTLRTAARRALARLAGLGCVAAFAAAAHAADTPAATPVRVALETSAGRIVIDVDTAKAPKSAANFLQYVKDGFYDGTIFHRVIDRFMIQGGGFTTAMAQKPTRAPIAAESTNGLKNVRGAVAMARTSDPNSATAQFFINVVDNPNLDYPSFDGTGYTVFGTVTEGMDVVDRIRAVATGHHGMYENVPVSPVVIKTARVVK